MKGRGKSRNNHRGGSIKPNGISWKRRVHFAMVLALVVAAPFLYSSCGGGGGDTTAVPTYGTVVIVGGSVQ